MGLAKLLIISLFLPNSLSLLVGSFRINGYRIILLAACLFSLSQLLNSRPRPSRTADRSVLAFGVWGVVALIANHEFSQALESGGIFFAETVGAYFIGRNCIASKDDIEKLAKFLIGAIIWLLVVTLPEMLTGVNVVWSLARVWGGASLSHIGERFGLTRAFGPFDHPIINGVICASLFGLAIKVYWRNKPIRVVAVILAAFTSISSGAVASIMVQSLIATWLSWTKGWRKQWVPLGLVLLIVYVILDLLSNRSGLKVIISYLTFSPGTAQWRLLIWEYGLDNVWANPLFGLGFNDWVRPEWMRSGSMDNFWLVNAVRYGVPGFLLLATVTLTLCRANAKHRESVLGGGWVIGVSGLIVSGCTVHFWNQAYVFFMFYLGLGAAICDFEVYSGKAAGKVAVPGK